MPEAVKPPLEIPDESELNDFVGAKMSADILGSLGLGSPSSQYAKYWLEAYLDWFMSTERTLQALSDKLRKVLAYEYEHDDESRASAKHASGEDWHDFAKALATFKAKIFDTMSDELIGKIKATLAEGDVDAWKIALACDRDQAMPLPMSHCHIATPFDVGIERADVWPDGPPHSLGSVSRRVMSVSVATSSPSRWRGSWSSTTHLEFGLLLEDVASGRWDRVRLGETRPDARLPWDSQELVLAQERLGSLGSGSAAVVLASCASCPRVASRSV